MTSTLVLAKRVAIGVTLVLSLHAGAASAAGYIPCAAERPEPMAVTDPELCRKLDPVIRKPSALPLDRYEQALQQYSTHFCYRNQAAGWVRDKFVRAVGPRVARFADGKWTVSSFGTHSPVMIWYSPEMVAWMKVNRPAGDPAPADPPPPPDGAIMVKELYPNPASACRDVDPLRLLPPYATTMVRDSAGSHDGWFWADHDIGAPGWKPDWPAPEGSPITRMGFGQYCINCHGSAQSYSTFAASENMEGEPGEPLTYLSQDFADAIPGTSGPARDYPSAALGDPRSSPDAAVVKALRAYVLAMPAEAAVARMAPATYDHDWAGPGPPDASETFLTSSQCMACHDAGGTGLQFDMTMPNPHGKGLLNLSQYATWRSSPMGLAGRDPIFFAQLASETQTFHPQSADLVESTCLGCHGIAGARQFQIDAHATTGACPTFTRDMVDAVPWPAGNPGAVHADYGMLARDGVTCTACHRMALTEAAMAKAAGAPENACIGERQAVLNPENTGFARTVTGSFLVGAPDAILGPFESPKTIPMENILGMTPVHDAAIASSEVCGSCHTVHLPILKDGERLGSVYEQATYPEWAFSDYRTGTTPDGDLPLGAGALSQSCQDCHMPSKEADGKLRTGKIASIFEFSNFPQTTFALGAKETDLPIRDGVSLHTLVGLNLFLIKIAEQFPDILGIRTDSAMLGPIGVPPLARTEQAILDQAANQTATVTVAAVKRDATTLTAEVTVKNLAGHKLPSGVGFRRAFIDFEVLDQNGETLWASGRTDPAGAIVGRDGTPIDGEHWWKEDCSGYLRPGERPHQPHFQTITAEDQAQIYQELDAAPPADAAAPVCGPDAAPAGELTTSFLSLCAPVKDNRILPAGFLPLASRVVIAAALGAGRDLAVEAGATAVGDDPDYVGGGGDTVTYAVPLADLPAGARPASLRATLYYQATPPYFLQDRFCTAKGKDTERLYYLAAHLDLDGTAAEGWKLAIGTSGDVPIP